MRMTPQTHCALIRLAGLGSGQTNHSDCRAAFPALHVTLSQRGNEIDRGC